MDAHVHTSTQLTIASCYVRHTRQPCLRVEPFVTHSQMKIENAISVLDGATRMTFRDQGSCSGGGVGRVMISRELKEVRFW